MPDQHANNKFTENENIYFDKFSKILLTEHNTTREEFTDYVKTNPPLRKIINDLGRFEELMGLKVNYKPFLPRFPMLW